MDKKPIELAVDALGSQMALAEALKVSKAFVNQLVHGHRPVPARWCIPIEEACCGTVTRYDLRPDVFGVKPVRRKAA